MPNLVKRGEVYYFQAQVDGKRYFESLQTPDRRTAQARAAVKLRAVREQRWDDLKASRVKKVRVSSIGEVIAAYKDEARLAGRPSAPTVKGCIAQLRRLVLVGGGLDSPDAAPLSVLTGTLCHRFRDAMLAAKGTVDADSRLRSVASMLTQARAVFKPRMLQVYRYRGLTVPDLADFKAYRIETAPVRWDPPDMSRLLVAASRLRETRPELEAVWVLAYELGLRAAEIAACRWNWFEERDGGRWCHVCERPDEGWKPKASGGWTPVPDQVWDRLRACQVGSDYVIGDLGATARDDRVEREFSSWMREHGWNRRECAHELRKVRGDLWAQEHGEGTASAWLRHAGISVTLRHYRDRERYTPIPAARASIES